MLPTMSPHGTIAWPFLFLATYIPFVLKKKKKKKVTQKYLPKYLPNLTKSNEKISFKNLEKQISSLHLSHSYYTH
jgi:hypothetical protein